mgnify:CR=1 FL=1
MNVRHSSLMAKAFDRDWIVAKAGKEWLKMSPEDYQKYKAEKIQDHLEATNREETCCEEMEERVVYDGGTPDYEFCPYCGDYVNNFR